MYSTFCKCANVNVVGGNKIGHLCLLFTQKCDLSFNTCSQRRRQGVCLGGGGQNAEKVAERGGLRHIFFPTSKLG